MEGLVLLGEQKVAIKKFADPSPASREVVVRVKAAGICGSDLHLYRLPSAFLKTDVIVGHEPAGIVEKVGKEVTTIKGGDRVAVYHYLSCGHCEYCVRGQRMLCGQAGGLGWKSHGADAEFLLIPAENCFVLPAELSYVDGMFMACAAGTVWSAFRKLCLYAADTLAVFGLGPVGMTAVLIAKALGAKVIGVDKDDFRLRFAADIGADACVDVKHSKVVEELRGLSQERGPTAVFEASGAPQAQKAAVSAVAKKGRVAMVGITDEALRPGADEINLMKPSELILKELTLYGSYIMTIGDFHELSRFLVEKKIRLDRLVTHRFSIHEAEQAFRLFQEGGTGKILFQFS